MLNTRLSDIFKHVLSLTCTSLAAINSLPSFISHVIDRADQKQSRD